MVSFICVFSHRLSPRYRSFRLAYLTVVQYLGVFQIDSRFYLA